METLLVVSWQIKGRVTRLGACASYNVNHLIPLLINLVPRTLVSFGQHQDNELWNSQLPESNILGVPVSRRMRAFVYMASRDKVDGMRSTKAFNMHCKN